MVPEESNDTYLSSFLGTKKLFLQAERHPVHIISEIAVSDNGLDLECI